MLSRGVDAGAVAHDRRSRTEAEPCTQLQVPAGGHARRVVRRCRSAGPDPQPPAGARLADLPGPGVRDHSRISCQHLLGPGRKGGEGIGPALQQRRRALLANHLYPRTTRPTTPRRATFATICASGGACSTTRGSRAASSRSPRPGGSSSTAGAISPLTPAAPSIASTWSIRRRKSARGTASSPRISRSLRPLAGWCGGLTSRRTIPIGVSVQMTPAARRQGFGDSKAGFIRRGANRGHAAGGRLPPLAAVRPRFLRTGKGERARGIGSRLIDFGRERGDARRRLIGLGNGRRPVGILLRCGAGKRRHHRGA